MLWFDNDLKADLQTKIERAVRYYRDKYGSTPNLCFVHPGMLPPREPAADPVEKAAPVFYEVSGVEVRAARNLLPQHLWIGVNQPALSTDEPLPTSQL